MISLKPKHHRLLFIAGGMVCVIGAVFFGFLAFRESIVFFYTPQELQKAPDLMHKRRLRLGGLVQEGSVQRQDLRVHFQITDLQAAFPVFYEGILPTLFREGKGVVAEGAFSRDGKIFIAHTILAKHDENYTPPRIPSP